MKASGCCETESEREKVLFEKRNSTKPARPMIDVLVSVPFALTFVYLNWRLVHYVYLSARSTLEPPDKLVATRIKEAGPNRTDAHSAL